MSRSPIDDALKGLPRMDLLHMKAVARRELYAEQERIRELHHDLYLIERALAVKQHRKRPVPPADEKKDIQFHSPDNSVIRFYVGSVPPIEGYLNPAAVSRPERTK